MPHHRRRCTTPAHSGTADGAQHAPCAEGSPLASRGHGARVQNAPNVATPLLANRAHGWMASLTLPPALLPALPALCCAAVSQRVAGGAPQRHGHERPHQQRAVHHLGAGERALGRVRQHAAVRGARHACRRARLAWQVQRPAHSLPEAAPAWCMLLLCIGAMLEEDGSQAACSMARAYTVG